MRVKRLIASYRNDTAFRDFFAAAFRGIPADKHIFHSSRIGQCSVRFAVGHDLTAGGNRNWNSISVSVRVESYRIPLYWRPMRIEGLVGSQGNNSVCGDFCPAAFRSIPAIECIAIMSGRRQCSISLPVAYEPGCNSVVCIKKRIQVKCHGIWRRRRGVIRGAGGRFGYIHCKSVRAQFIFITVEQRDLYGFRSDVKSRNNQ